MKSCKSSETRFAKLESVTPIRALFEGHTAVRSCIKKIEIASLRSAKLKKLLDPENIYAFLNGHVYFVLMHETVYPELSGTRHFLVNSADRPRICANPNQIRMNPGTIDWIRPKVASEFSKLENREDGSDFDDFWTELIASVQTFFSQIFARTKKFSRRRKKIRGDEKISQRTNDRTNEVPESSG